MPAGEEDTVFSSKIKYNGIFSFTNFYSFAYSWLTEESALLVSEGKYSEKLKGDSKDIEVEWEGTKKVSDYFKFKIKISFKVIGLTKIDITEGNAKVSTNKGSIEVGIKGILVKDYAGKFEKSAFQKFMRGIYEKWVIASRVEELQSKLAGTCDTFLGQSKAYLDLEGRK